MEAAPQEELTVEVLPEADALLDEKREEEPEEAKAPSAMSLLWPAYLCILIDFMGLGISIPILPYFTLQLGWTESDICPEVCPEQNPLGELNFKEMCGLIPGCGNSIDVGAVIGCFSFGQVLGNFIMGRLSDRVGRKPIVMASLLASSSGYVWCGLAPTLPHLYAARIFSGIAGGTLPVVQAMILDVAPPLERPKLFGLCGAQLGLAFILGPGLGSGVAAGLGKRAALFAPVVLAVITLIVAFFRVPETRREGGLCGPRSKRVNEYLEALPKASGQWNGQKLAPKDGPPAQHNGGAHDGSSAKQGGGKPPQKDTLPTMVYVCAVAMCLGSFAFSTMTSMAALVWMELFDYGSTELGIFLTGAGVVGLFSNIFGVQYAVRRIGALRTVLVASFLLMIGIGGWTFIENKVLHMAFFLLTLKLGYDFQMPTLASIAGDAVKHPGLRGKATGLVAAGMSLGMAVSPFISGPLFRTSVLFIEHEYGGFSHLIFLIGAGSVAVQIVLLLSFARPAKTPMPRGPSL